MLNLILGNYLADWGMLVLRIALGAILVAHGRGKIKNIAGTSAWLGSVGFKPGKFWGPVVACVEFFGGISIILGLFTNFVALLIAGQFVVINFWKIGKGDKFVGGWELDLIMLGAAAALLFYGAGSVSLDAWFHLL